MSGVATVVTVAVVALVTALATAVVSRYVSLSGSAHSGEIGPEPAAEAATTPDAEGTIAALRRRIRRQRGDL